MQYCREDELDPRQRESERPPVYSLPLTFEGFGSMLCSSEKRFPPMTFECFARSTSPDEVSLMGKMS